MVAGALLLFPCFFAAIVALLGLVLSPSRGIKTFGELFLPILLVSLVCLIVAGGILRYRERSRLGQTRKPSKPLWEILGLSVVAAICGLMPLIDSQYGGRDREPHQLLRVFPVSDANTYLIGANRLLIEGRLDEWNSRRPLNASFLGANLGVLKGDFEGAMALQGLFWAICATLSVYLIRSSLGLLPAFATILLFALLSYHYLASPLSYTLGFSLGMLSVGLFVEGLRTRSILIIGFGSFLLTLALLSRAGAFFVLPAVVLFGTYYYGRSQSGFLWRRAFFCGGLLSASVVAGFFVNFGVLVAHDGSAGNVNGNFAHTLYGIARGGEDWQQIYRDFPEGRGAAGSAENRFIFKKAFESIEREPGLFVKGLLNRVFEVQHFGNFGREFLRGTGFIPHAKWLGFLIFALLCLALIRLWRWKRTAGLFWLFFMIGLLLSLPVITDGGFRVKGATLPFVCFLLAISVFPWKESRSVETGDGSRFGAATGAAVALTSFLVLWLLVVPKLSKVSTEKVAGRWETAEDTMLFRPGMSPVSLMIPDEKFAHPYRLPSGDPELFSQYTREERNRRSYMTEIESELVNGSVVCQLWTEKGYGWRVLVAVPMNEWQELSQLSSDKVVALPSSYQIENR